MPELLVELFSEEIPARFQTEAARDLERLVNQHLLDAGFLPEAVKAFAGPRRLTVVASGLPVRQADRREEKKGPRVDAPAAAIEGFLKSAGLSSLAECERREDKKGAFWIAALDRPGRATVDVIADVIPRIVRDFPWQKSMRWGAGDLRWVRPLKRILCVFDGEIVPFSVDDLTAADITEGHRIMAPEEIRVRSFERYEASLKAARVILDADERARLIAGEAKTLCEASGFELARDTALLREVAGLAEWPVVMLGSFDAKFLSLPDEVLSASMRGHQKYFSVRDPGAGRLANRFIVVANLEAPDGGAAMLRGYERVLTARLSDAWYLYHQDSRTSLVDRCAELDRVTFFEGLGSVGDKSRRIAALAREIATSIGANPHLAERAALLAKADLTSGMVYEFPELQGVMGRYYALAQGEDPAVADAIRDHYLPKGADDAIPTAPVSVAVALADRIDTLAAFYAIDQKPTGSSDPFALRRAALGVIRTLIDNNVRLDLRTLIDSALSEFGNVLRIKDRKVALSGVRNFVLDRLRVYLRDGGWRHDYVSAAYSDYAFVPVDPIESPIDIVLIVRRLEALTAFLGSDDGANLAAAFKRAANILNAEQKKGPLPDPLLLAESLLSLEEERALFTALQRAEAAAGKAVADGDYPAAMRGLAAMRAPIDAFFENVTVNADDPALRARRLALLQRFIDATRLVADLSKLEG